MGLGSALQGVDVRLALAYSAITAIVREHIAGLTRGNAGPIDPVQIDIRHHHSGQTRVSARGGRGPTMQAS